MPQYDDRIAPGARCTCRPRAWLGLRQAPVQQRHRHPEYYRPRRVSKLSPFRPLRKSRHTLGNGYAPSNRQEP